MSLHYLDHNQCRLRIDAAQGARITEFSLRGKNSLFMGLPEWGSTFWPSPQHAWGWPPPPDLDSAPYQCQINSNSMELTSDICRITQLQLRKTVALDPRGFKLIYRLTNHANIAQAFAPWEISRVAGGLTFFSSSELPQENSTLPLHFKHNCYWHDYQVASQTDNLKSFVNGSEGWLANANQGLLLLKRFAPVSKNSVAPLEAEIEIYAHGDSAQPYIEVEQQGIYETLAPGQALEWQVIWSLFEIPSEIDVEAGSLSLLHWVNTLLATS